MMDQEKEKLSQEANELEDKPQNLGEIGGEGVGEAEKEMSATQEETVEVEEDDAKQKEEQGEDGDAGLEQMFQNIVNNSGNINIYFQNRKYFTNHGIVTGDGAQFRDVYVEDEKQKPSSEQTNEMIEDSGKLCQWITDNYNTMAVPYLISCAVFHSMPYIWISEAAEELFILLRDNDEIQKTIFGRRAIKEFGAEIYNGAIDTDAGKFQSDCVRFAKDNYPDIILKCVWNDFPQIRERITEWLKGCMLFDRETMFNRINSVLGKLAQEDYYYFTNSIVKQLHQEKSILMDMGLAQIVVSINENKKYKENIDMLLKTWSGSKEAHYLLTLMFVCQKESERVNCLKKAIHSYLYQVIQSLVKGKNTEFTDKMFGFYATGMRSYTFYRIMIEKLCEFTADKNYKLYACHLFLMLFSIDTVLVRFEKHCMEEPIFIKLTYTTSEIRHHLCRLWQMLWQSNLFRKRFYLVLGEYYIQIEADKRQEKIYQFVEAAFSGVCSIEYIEDITEKIQIQCRRMEKNE